MVSRIYKYPLFPSGGPRVNTCLVEMPSGARVLCVQAQRDELCVWAVVNPARQLRTHVFDVFGTGHPLPPELPGSYLGTVQLYGGDLVLHVFYEGPTYAG
jgi:hypothetical protein